MPSKREVWLVDPVGHWRRWVADDLGGRSFRVKMLDYFDAIHASRSPDMVILDCCKVGARERNFARHFIAKGVPVSVYATRLSSEDVRDLMHSGATDVGKRPRTPRDLVGLMSKTFKALGRRRARQEAHFTAALV